MSCSPSATSLIERMYAAALAAVDPKRSVAERLQLHRQTLSVADQRLELPGRLVVVAIGKAGERMAEGAVQSLGGRIDAGYVVTKYGHVSRALDTRFQVFEAGHPVPDQASVEATHEVIEAVSSLGERDTVLALISGGGSALLEAPVEPVTLDDLARVTSLLLTAGAPIQDLNAVRIPLSRVKGGRLRQSSPAGRFVTLILSDVLGNDPHVVASGPTVAGSLSASDALEVIRRFGLDEAVPRAVTAALAENRCSEPEHVFRDDVVEVIADNAAAIESSAACARSERWPVETIWLQREGEASELGKEWIDAAAGRDGPVVLLGGGEATVTVSGDGRGGRNTEFALAAALELADRELGHWTIASLATDGQDAMTEAAGAIACAQTIDDATDAGLDPRHLLDRNDSLAVFETVHGLIVTGPTGTNVNDLYFAVNEGRMS